MVLAQAQGGAWFDGFFDPESVLSLLWPAAGWGLFAVGLWIVVAALFADAARARPVVRVWRWRGRGEARRRCPRCWYSMEGVAASVVERKGKREQGWVCPECGKGVVKRGGLYKTRRSLRLVLAGVVVMAAVPTTWTVLKARRDGLHAATPSIVLVLGMDLWDGDQSWPSGIAGPGWRTGVRPGKPAPLQQRLGAEMLLRLDGEKSPEIRGWLRSLALQLSIAKLDSGDLVDQREEVEFAQRVLRRARFNELPRKFVTMLDEVVEDYVILPDSTVDGKVFARLRQPWWTGPLMGELHVLFEDTDAHLRTRTIDALYSPVWPPDWIDERALIASAEKEFVFAEFDLAINATMWLSGSDWIRDVTLRVPHVPRPASAFDNDLSLGSGEPKKIESAFRDCLKAWVKGVGDALAAQDSAVYIGLIGDLSAIDLREVARSTPDDVAVAFSIRVLFDGREITRRTVWQDRAAYGTDLERSAVYILRYSDRGYGPDLFHKALVMGTFLTDDRWSIVVEDEPEVVWRVTEWRERWAGKIEVVPSEVLNEP